MSESLEAQCRHNRKHGRSVAHPYEREAVGLLYQAGWSLGELSMVFEVGKDGIRRILDEQGVEL